MKGKIEFCQKIAIKNNFNKCPFYVCDFLQKLSSAVNISLQNETITNTTADNFKNETEATVAYSQVSINDTFLSENSTSEHSNDSLLRDNSTNKQSNDSF
jgi:hypothetical protein